MKIAITSKIGGIEEIDDEHTIVASVQRLRELMSILDINEDIDGKIYPSAKHNPELKAILREIYKFKRDIHEKTGRKIICEGKIYTCHGLFAEILKAKNIVF